MLFLLGKNEAPSMFVRSIGMKIKLMQNFAVFVSLSSFYIIRSGLSALQSKDCVFRYVHTFSKSLACLGIVRHYASIKLVKPFRRTSIGISMHTSQYTDNDGGVMV